jgi:hypothetical protein
MSDDTRPRIEVTIAAPVDVVWDALRDKDKIRHWLGWDYDGLGGEIDLIFFTETVEEASARTLRLHDGDEFRLESHGEATRVTLTHARSLALGQDQRCRRVLGRAGSRAPASVVVAHRQHRTGDGQVQPDRPRIARCGSGDDSEATVGITGIAAPDRESCCPIEGGWPVDANHGLPLRPPQHSSAVPLEGQHPSGQRHGQRCEAAAGGQPREPPARQGVEAARAPRIGGVVSTSDALEPALGPGVSRIAGTARQRDEQIAPLPGQLVGPHHPLPVHGRSQMLVEFSGQAGPGAGTGDEVRYQAISAAHGDLFSPVANPRVTSDRRLHTEIPDRGQPAPQIRQAAPIRHRRRRPPGSGPGRPPITKYELTHQAQDARNADSAAPVIVLVRPSSNSQNIQFAAVIAPATGLSLRPGSGCQAASTRFATPGPQTMPR